MEQPVLILGALREEIAGVRRGMSVEEQFKAGRADVWTGTLEGTRIALVRTGVGKACAEKALEEVLHRIEPALILSVGYAGGLSPDLKIGDLVIADRVLEDTHSNPSRAYTIGSAWLARAESLTLPDGISLHRGVLVTVDEPVTDPLAKRALGSRHNALAVDMETAVLIQLADAKGIPFLSVRAISDGVDQSLIDVSSLIGEDGAVSKLKAGWYAVTHPQTIPHFISLREQSQKATRNLTEFLKEFLQVSHLQK